MAIKETEWGQAVVLMKKNFKKPWFLETKMEADLWYNALLNEGLEYEDVISGVRVLVSTKRSNDLPELPDLIDASIDARSFRIEEELKSMNKNTTEVCKNCLGVGGVFRVYPNQSELFVPCGCQTGRSKYPWAFKTVTELREDFKTMRKKGQHPSDVYFNSQKLDPSWEKAYLEDTRTYHHLSKLRFGDTGKVGAYFEKHKENTGRNDG